MKDLPPLAKTVRGEENFGEQLEHAMIYGDSGGRFIWGIIVPRDTSTSDAYTEVPEPRAVVGLRSGITLEFINNKLVISKGAVKKTLQLTPYTLYLVNENLSVNDSKNLSGIKLVPKKRYDWENGRSITTQDLVLPANLYARFGRNCF